MRKLLFVSSAFLLSGCGLYNHWVTQDPFLVPNPDPNHIHADFAISIKNDKVDLTDDKFMSGLSTDDSTHDEEGEYLHQLMHLHDHVGHVMHMHKPGYTIGEFLATLSIEMTDSCVTLHTGKIICRSDQSKWKMFLNGEPVSFDPGYIVQDLDKILLTYGSTDSVVQEQIITMTDDACLYSRRCPWRGEPPAENCVADPSVPCVVPEEDL